MNRISTFQSLFCILPKHISDIVVNYGSSIRLLQSYYQTLFFPLSQRCKENPTEHISAPSRACLHLSLEFFQPEHLVNEESAGFAINDLKKPTEARTTQTDSQQPKTALHHPTKGTPKALAPTILQLAFFLPILRGQYTH